MFRSMMFLNGLLAGFTVLGSIPIIIHLLNKSRFRVVEWGAMEFILRTLQKNSRRLQFRDLILLILRTLAIIFAALALARPTISDSGFAVFGAGGGINSVIVVDNGLSMQCRDANDTRFEIARKTAKEILTGLPRGSAATLVMASDIAVSEVAEPTQDLSYLDQVLDKAEAGDGGSDITGSLQAAWDILEAVGGGARELYLITDLQAHGWPDGQDRAWRELMSRLSAAEGIHLFLVDVGDDNSSNVSVERLAFTDEIIGTDGTTTIVATLRNNGMEPATAIPVDLLIDDGTGMRSAANTVVDQLDSITQVRLQARFEHGGRHKIEVRTGPDHLDADNVRRAVVDVVDRVQVLVVEGGTGQAATFVRAALAPSSLLDDSGIEDLADGAQDRFAVTVVNPAQLVGLHLDDYQTIILSNVDAPGDALAEGLRSYVAAGHGLITLLGADIQPLAYNTSFGSRGLMYGTIGNEPTELVREDREVSTGETFSTDQLLHPIVSMFADKETQIFLAQPRVKTIWPLTIPEAVANQAVTQSVILRLANGAPAATISTVGRGQAMTLSMGLDKTWTDLPLKPAFVMLLRRSIQHLALGDRPRLIVDVHEPVVQAISARDGAERFSVQYPVNLERSVTPVTREDGRSQIEFADTDRAGFVDFHLGDRSWSFAVNAPSEESDITRLSREAIEERLNPVRLTWLNSGDDVAARLEQGRFGREIWPFLFALAVACLIAETILALKWAPKTA